MKTRIMFINPNTEDWWENKEYYVPLNYLYLSGLITQAGYENTLLDLNIVKYKRQLDIDTEILRKIETERPTIVGIGCLFSGQFDAVIRYSKLIKDTYPHIKIVIGGIHPTLYYKEILTNCPTIDFIVAGEGEYPLLRLMDFLEGRGTIDGAVRVAYRDANNNVQYREGADYVDNLDMLPFPNYKLITLSDYYHDTSKWHNPHKLPINASLPVLSSRACPLRCNFCIMWAVMGKKWRHRSVSNVVDELEWLHNEYDHHHFSMLDDNLTVSKEHTISMCNEIVKRGLKIQFETPNGVSTKFMDEEVLDALVRAGLVRVSFAIESGSDYIRNVVMGKRLSNERIHEVIQLTKKHERELYVRTFFIMGMPEDTHETLQETYDMIVSTDVDKPIVSTVIPFPGTRVFAQAVKDGLLTDELDMSSIWKYGGFFFTGQKKVFLKPYKMEVDEVSEWRNKFNTLIDSEIKRKLDRRQMLYV